MTTQDIRVRARRTDSRAMLALLAALTIAVLALTAWPASAATVEECQAQLTTLRTDTVAATGSLNAKDASGLVAKVDAATAELAAGKNADATQKLTDYQAKLSALASAPKPKVDPVAATTLTTQAQQTVDCIASLGMP